MLGPSVRITAAPGAPGEVVVVAVATRAGDEKNVTVCPVASVGTLYTATQAVPGPVANAMIHWD